MTIEEQFKEYDRLRRFDIARAEMKTREIARAAATNDRNIAGVQRFPVIGPRRMMPAGPGLDAYASPYWEIVVDLHPALDGNERVLIAEKIVRPQLRAAGWRIES